jgi:hypothetical protein
MIEHLDEHGAPCKRHPLTVETLLGYAAIGSRASGFHHDAASKLQSLMMALDEIDEIVGQDASDIRQATDTAQMALRELHALLTYNRALAKAPQRKKTPLGELITRAADRHGVKVKGDIGAFEPFIAPPSMTHAFAILLDLIAGPVQAGRVVDVQAERTDERVTLALVGGAEPTQANANELIAIASYLITREEGQLRCAPKGFIVQLPLT